VKIKKIEGIFLFAPFERKLGNSLVWFEGKSSNYLKVELDEGITGYGEAYGFDREPLSQAMKSLFPHFVNFQFDKWEDLEGHLRRKLPVTVSTAIRRRLESALNLAYWDIRGKIENKPVCELFGSKPKRHIPVYGTGLFYREVSDCKQQLPLLLPEMQRFIAAGYHGIKMKAGKYPVEQEAWLIGQIRKELPSTMSLMVDANCGMRSMEETKELMKRLEQIGVKWLEEPFSPDAYGSYKEVCAQRNELAVAAGENESMFDGFPKLIASGVTILQPELSLCGGFSNLPALIELANQHQVQLTPHVWGSGILYSATLNFYSMLGSGHTLPYECPFLDDPLRDRCFTHISIKYGFIDAPAHAGLGVEFDQEQLDRYVTLSV
jgi:D-galactarolactone cycloisomerase